MFIPVLLLYGSCVSRPVSYNSGFIDKEGVKIAVVHFKDYNVSEGNNSGELVRNVFEDILLKRGYGIVEIEKSAALLTVTFSKRVMCLLNGLLKQAALSEQTI